jgi:hypothetical protein
MQFRLGSRPRQCLYKIDHSCPSRAMPHWDVEAQNEAPAR